MAAAQRQDFWAMRQCLSQRFLAAVGLAPAGTYHPLAAAAASCRNLGLASLGSAHRCCPHNLERCPTGPPASQAGAPGHHRDWPCGSCEPDCLHACCCGATAVRGGEEVRRIESEGSESLTPAGSFPANAAHLISPRRLRSPSLNQPFLASDPSKAAGRLTAGLPHYAAPRSNTFATPRPTGRQRSSGAEGKCWGLARGGRDAFGTALVPPEAAAGLTTGLLPRCCRLQADEEKARGMAGWAKDKVEDVVGNVKDKIGSGGYPRLGG